MRDINLNNIKDKDVRDALNSIKEILFEDLQILRGDWVYFEITVAVAGAHFEEHNLGYVPKDIIITYDTANFSRNYSTTTDEVLSFTTGSDGIIRGFYGSYEDKETQ